MRFPMLSLSLEMPLAAHSPTAYFISTPQHMVRTTIVQTSYRIKPPSTRDRGYIPSGQIKDVIYNRVICLSCEWKFGVLESEV
jgi:hypothetical protein